MKLKVKDPDALAPQAEVVQEVKKEVVIPQLEINTKPKTVTVSEALDKFSSPKISGLGGISNKASKIIQESKEVVKVKDIEPQEDDQEVFVQLDRRDERQIIEQLNHGYMGDFVYEYCPRHKWPEGKRPSDCSCNDTIMDLSWMGIQEASRSMRITVRPGKEWFFFDEKGAKIAETLSQVNDPGLTVHEFPDRVRVIVTAKDPIHGMERIGVATQPKNTSFYGKIKPDDFYLQKAMSKAERNSLRQLLPQTAIKMWIDKFLIENNGSVTTQPVSKEQPQKVTGESINALLKISVSNSLDLTKEYIEKIVKTESNAQYCFKQCESEEGTIAFIKWITPKIA